MTATNHAFTGAMIALAVSQPVLAIPLAFVSHFVLDAVPHFGVHEDDVIRRNGNRLFQVVVGVDVVCVIGLLLLLPFGLHRGVPWWTLLVCMLAAISPDMVWVYRFLKEVKTKRWNPGNRFVRFHQAIQWSEKPWGLSVELMWFAMLSLILVKT